MRFVNEKKHVIDFVFPAALFFVFAASSLIVIILAANIYSSGTNSSRSSFETRTSLSYITEKIHQSDENGSVSIGTFEGKDALIIRQTYSSDVKYSTYIYEDSGKLKELFIQDGIDVSPSSGKEIMPVRNFKMKEISDGKFEFSCSLEGQTVKTTVSTKSSEEGIYE